MRRWKGVAEIPGLGRQLNSLLFQRRMSKTALAEAAGVSREVVHTALRDHATYRTVERLAEGLYLTVDDILNAAVGDPIQSEAERVDEESEDDSGEPSAQVEELQQSHAIRVWLADFRAELTKARATDAEIEAAIAMVSAPEVFAFFAGQDHESGTQEEVAIEALSAMADVVRSRLALTASRRKVTTAPGTAPAPSLEMGESKTPEQIAEELAARKRGGGKRAG